MDRREQKKIKAVMEIASYDFSCEIFSNSFRKLLLRVPGKAPRHRNSHKVSDVLEAVRDTIVFVRFDLY